ncbi:MAG: alpha/beta hydrolase [Planctomycetaceae bacterium]
MSQPDEAAARPRPVAAVTNPRAMRPQRPARGVQPAGGNAQTAAARPGTPAAPQPGAGSRSAGTISSPPAPTPTTPRQGAAAGATLQPGSGPVATAQPATGPLAAARSAPVRSSGPTPAGSAATAATNRPMALSNTGASEAATAGSNTGAGPDPGWIISSREVRGTPERDDCTAQFEYFRRSPQGPVPVSREQFLATVRPDRPVCFMIHGSYNAWSDVVKESDSNVAFLREAAGGQDVQVVCFTWPSNGYVPVLLPVELRLLGRKAAVHGGYLAQLISRLGRKQPVTVVGHSHGARCAVAALHALGGGTLDDNSRLARGTGSPESLRCVLLAAAVDHDWLNPGKRYDRALYPVESMLVVHNARDGWLGVYPLHAPLKGQQALGRSGITRQDRQQLNGLANKIDLFDAGPITGRSHDLATFNSSPDLARVLGPYVLRR